MMQCFNHMNTSIPIRENNCDKWPIYKFTTCCNTFKYLDIYHLCTVSGIQMGETKTNTRPRKKKRLI